jgi:hypothetical protein
MLGKKLSIVEAQMDDQWQRTVDWLAHEIAYEESSLGGSRIILDWGNYTIECADYPPLREAIIKMAKDYRRLRGLELSGKIGIMEGQADG